MNEQLTPEQALSILYAASEIAQLQPEQRRAVLAAYDLLLGALRK